MNDKSTSPKLWRPYTQEVLATPALKAISAKGSKIFLEDGRELLDCISSWWVNVHGHSTQKLAEALATQSQILDQVVFADFTHDPAEILIKELAKIIPPKLNRYFFSDNGSTAVEVALKMVLGYWQNLGNKNKKKFVAFSGAYHGDTFGSMAVSSRSIFTRSFDSLLFEVETIPYPEIFEGKDSSELEETSLQKLEYLLKNKSEEIAGIIIEPLLQGASGMKMCSIDFLKKLSHLATKNKCPLIFDEVLTGFGRTGEWFSCIKAEIVPTVICLSKGISGGAMPLGMTITNQEIYDSFNSGKFENTFFHGHSYTGNALACSCAIASLQHFKEVGERFRNFEAIYRSLFLESLADIKNIENVRFCGTIFAFDLKSPDQNYGSAFGNKIKLALIEEGIYLRPLGNTIYLMPPYCFSESELEFVFSKLKKVLLASH